MAIDSHNPMYDEFLPSWQLMLDCFEGESAIKNAGKLYLPPTEGQERRGMGVNQDGFKAYLAYKMRARVPGHVKRAVVRMIGIMHQKQPTIKLPKKLEYMLTNATDKGESLVALIRAMNTQQLVEGRLGLLLDVDPETNLPYIIKYKAKDIINWATTRDTNAASSVEKVSFVILNETGQALSENDPFEWVTKEQYRIIRLEAGSYKSGVYKSGEEYDASRMVAPSIKGKTSPIVPFVFVNSQDLLSNPAQPPLLPLGQHVVAMYRSSADYRQTLYMQGQDTLVVKGVIDDEIVAGAGAYIKLSETGDAKYIGVQSKGLGEMRQAEENDTKEASDMGGDLVDTRSSEPESGEALRIRVSARTASVTQVALVSQEALSTILKQAAVWIGENPDEVKVEVNTDYADDLLDGQTMVNMMGAKGLGLPLSNKSIHGVLKRKGMTEMEYQDELDEIEGEEPLGATTNTVGEEPSGAAGADSTTEE